MAEKSTFTFKGRVTGNHVDWKDRKTSRISLNIREDNKGTGDNWLPGIIHDFDVEGWFTIGASVKATFEVK